MEPALRIEGLSKLFGKTAALRDVTLDIGRGQVISIIGPSGAGKTTLLRCVSMLERIDGGRIILGREHTITKDTGEAVMNEARKRIGVVFQDFHLWPHKTALENVAYAPMMVNKESTDDAAKKARELLAEVGLSHKTQEYPATLSGGQRQRVAIARALAMEPDVLLLDEITSALDPELVSGILQMIKGLAHDGRTMIVVTHNMDFAREVSHKVVLLDNGRVVEENVPQLLFHASAGNRARAFLRNVI